MSIAIILLLVVIFFAFVFTVYKAAPEWRWYHITTAVISMILSIVFLFPTAGVLKSRAAWHKLKEELETQYEDVQETRKVLQYGDDAGAPGLKAMSLALSKVGGEAGRRWRSMTLVQQSQNGQGKLEIVLRKQNEAVDPNLGGAAAPAPAAGPIIPESLVVYGFGEGQFQNVSTPMMYLGEFKVVNSVGNSVTITPTTPLEQVQQTAITSGRATLWSIYEMLPLDGHTPFIAEGSVGDNDNFLGRIDEELIKQLLPPVTNSPNQTLVDTRNRTIASYLRDGQRGKPEEPEAKWIRVTLDKKYTIDVDSPDKRGALEGGFFDNNGRSVDSRLQRADGGTIEFAAGEELIVTEAAAAQMKADGVIASVEGDTYYVRPLNDYRFVLRRIRLEITELEARIKELQYEEQVLQSAVASTADMIEKRQIEKVKLEADLAQYQVEGKAIKAYHAEVSDSLRKMNETAASLYQSNQSLLRQIEQLSRGKGLTDT
ncbi:MAG: hypothetical protein AAFX06_28075 [Planctomycetota bacterium]